MNEVRTTSIRIGLWDAILLMTTLLIGMIPALVLAFAVAVAMGFSFGMLYEFAIAVLEGAS